MRLPTISVLGCGWLGLPLAAALAERGHAVRGSTTSPEKLNRLAALGITPHRVVIGEVIEGDDLEGFFASDLLIATVPPSGSGVAYPDVMHAVRSVAEREGVRWTILTSSSSVYPNLDRVVTESDAGAVEGAPLRRNGAAVLAAEQVLQASECFETTVLRLAGLWGRGRHPARALAGRKDLAGGEAPVNLVHRDDVIRAVEAVLDHGLRGTTFNVCGDAHPTRRQLYPVVAARLGLEPPTFADGTGEGFKIVSSQRLQRRLGFTFHYPDPAQPAP